jgi:hypothetical protein
MNDKAPHEELIIRFLDGSLSPAEVKEVSQMLEENFTARDFLRDLSEQAVAVADLERTGLAVQDQSNSAAISNLEKDDQAFLKSFLQISFKWVLPIAALITLLAVIVKDVIHKDPTSLLKISKLSSVCHIFTAHGTIVDTPDVLMPILEGDTIESRSCDSWLQLQLGEKSRITLAGHSYLQNMEKLGDTVQLRFLTGSMWAEVAEESEMSSFNIHTPTCLIHLENAQFDLHTEPYYTRLRVNKGTALVTRFLDQVQIEIRSGQKIEVTLDLSAILVANEQPAPVNRWQCHLSEGPDITLGQVLPSFENEFANIKAEPLPWKVKENLHVMLYAVAFSVSRSSAEPVLIEKGSKLRYFLSYDRPDRVRFGFSTQRMRGVYAGKFETDVQPEQLGAPGEILMVELEMEKFWPTSPQLSSKPEGLEVSDIYALTINNDAGLKIHRIEIIPPEGELRH